MEQINWKKEAQFINTYSDTKIKGTEEAVRDYLDNIICLNGEQYLYLNEKELLKN